MPGARSIGEVYGWRGQVNRDSPQARGLVCAGWPSSPIFIDASGNGNQATNSGSARAITSMGMALSCAAGSEKVEDATALGLATGTSAPWSLSFWHYTRTYVSLSQVWGYGSTPASNTSLVQRRLLQFNNNYYFWGGSADWDSGVAWDVGVWRFVEVVSTGSDLILYIDGVSRASRGSLPSLATAETVITAFSKHPASASSPDMLLVDPRIYNIGHTPSEVRHLYGPQTRYDLFWVPRRSAPKKAATAAGGFSTALFRANAGLGAIGGGPFARANAGVGAVA